MVKVLAVVAMAMVVGVAAAAVQKTGTLKGKIEDIKGKPIAGADVRVLRHRDRSTKETKTDESGSYTFDLTPDDYTVSFDAEGFQGGTLVQMQQVEEDKETVVKTIRLDRSKKKTSLVRGAVFDSNGLVLAGAKVKLVRIATEEEEKEHKKHGSLTMDYVTNGRGEFAFRLPSVRARYKVTASAQGYKPDTRMIDVNEDESVPLAFSLERTKK